LIQLVASKRWQALVRSVRGASHVRAGIANQDAGRTAVLKYGKAVILATADGHGNPLHARSHTGAAYAVEAATEVVLSWINAVEGVARDAVLRSAARLPELLVAAWRQRVLADLKSHPRRPDEIATRAGSEQVERDPTILYGSTLLVAAVTTRFAIYIQLGDGDIVTVTAKRPPQRPLSGRTDLALSQTESLCQADAAERVRIQLGFFSDVPRPDLILLATDGYVNSFADDRAFLMVGSELKAFFDTKGLDWVGENLSRWLDETSRKGSGDDITLAAAWFARPAGARPGLRFALVAATLLILFAPVGWLSWDWIDGYLHQPTAGVAVSLTSPSAINAVAFSPDGALIAVASEQGVDCWNLSTGKILSTVKQPSGAWGVAFTPDGRSVAAATDTSVQIIDVESGRVIASLPEQANRVRSLAISPDGMLIVFAGKDAISTWDLKEQDLKDSVQPLDRDGDRVSSLAFAPDGRRIASGGSDDRIKIWDAVSRAELASFEAQSGGVWAITFSPAGDTIASGGQDGNVRLWSVEDQKLVRKFEGPTGRVRSIAFSRDGNRIAMANGKVVMLFDAKTGQRLASLEGHTAEVHSVAFSPDGRLLVSGGRDKAIRVWDVAASVAKQKSPDGGSARPQP
jgi:WD40 repeat protein